MEIIPCTPFPSWIKKKAEKQKQNLKAQSSLCLIKLINQEKMYKALDKYLLTETVKQSKQSYK